MEITAARLRETLKSHFGYDDFRPNQQAIISHILSGQDTVVVMPTGGGKSICYQLPALLLPGITIVVSPLIALMKDQVDALRQNGIAADFFNSQQSAEDKHTLRESLSAGALKLVYAAPESLNGLLSMIDPATISLIAVDEAHCISAWGHDFRPAYTQLSHLKSRLNCPLVALTATADKATRADIAQQLSIPDAQLFLSSFNRANLSLTVVPGQNKFKQILTFLQQHPNEAGIIYCLSRQSTTSLAEKLREKGYSALAYHAGLPADEREAVQDQFIKDDADIICATVAFGMGIDKSNVRWVIHHNLPKNIEGYYQEIGRAGRDGLDADTLLFYSYRDVTQLRQFAESSNEQQSAIQIAKLERMQQYAEALTCRRKILLSYFGEYLNEDCGNCDICQHPPANFDGSVLAQKALSAIARLKQSEPMSVVIDLLRGMRNHYLLERGYDQLPTHGAGADVSWKDWQQYLIQLINQGYIEIAYHEHHRLKLPEAARGVLRGETPVTLAKVIDATERLKTQQQISATRSPNEALFERLRAVRKALAEQADVPAFVIFSDATLQDMAALRPQNNAQFLAVSGVGESKLARYGQTFIDAIDTFIANEAAADKPSKMPTLQATFELHQQGLTPQQIAEKRELTLSTIVDHLCKAHQLGQAVDVTRLVSDSDVNAVRQAQFALGNPTALKPYFEHLEGEIDYPTLKLALLVLAEESA